MATSSSYDYNLTAQNIIEAAHRKLGVLGVGRALSSAQLQNGLQALNTRIKSYPALIHKIWGVNQNVQAMQTPTVWVDDADATKNWEAIVPHTTVAANRPTSGDDYIAYYKSSSTTGASWSTAQSAVSKSVYSIDSKIVDIENVRIILESNRLEYELKKISRYEFQRNRDKTVEGTPSEYYFERLNTGTTSYVHLYPSPSDTSGVLVFDAVKYPQDIDNQLDDLDFPQEWYSALIYGVAIDLAPEFSSVSSATTNYIIRLFKEYEAKALVLDEESGSIFFQPGRK